MQEEILYAILLQTITNYVNFFWQEVDKCLVDGADEYLQMLSLFAVVMQQMTQNN